jgi:hypothetical protein
MRIKVTAKKSVSDKPTLIGVFELDTLLGDLLDAGVRPGRLPHPADIRRLKSVGEHEFKSELGSVEHHVRLVIIGLSTTVRNAGSVKKVLGSLACPARKFPARPDGDTYTTADGSVRPASWWAAAPKMMNGDDSHWLVDTDARRYVRVLWSRENGYVEC